MKGNIKLRNSEGGEVGEEREIEQENLKKRCWGD